MYKFSVYSFSSKEIDQICELVKEWSMGRMLPVDARKLSKQVKEYALNYCLLERKNGRLYITAGYRFNIHYNFPIEALWRLVQPMLREDGTAGYSIVNNALWMQNLGIAPRNSRFATERELEEQESILLELAASHYINVQMAGNAWSIYIEEKVA